jgi:multiple sugar transport system permease protein
MTQPLRQAEEDALLGQLPEEYEQRLGRLQDLLGKAVRKANREMLGVYTPAELTARRITALLALLAIVTAFTLAVRRITHAFVPRRATSESDGSSRWRTYWPAALLLLPALLTILFWQYLPLLRGSLMAFMDYRLMGGIDLGLAR